MGLKIESPPIPNPSLVCEIRSTADFKMRFTSSVTATRPIRSRKARYPVLSLYVIDDTSWNRSSDVSEIADVKLS